MRMMLLALLATVAHAFAQGTISISTITTVTANAGTLSCVMTYQVPTPATGLKAECTDGTTTATLDLNVVIGPNGGGVRYAKGTDLIIITLARLSSSTPISWGVIANGTARTGTFQ